MKELTKSQSCVKWWLKVLVITCIELYIEHVLDCVCTQIIQLILRESHWKDEKLFQYMSLLKEMIKDVEVINNKIPFISNCMLGVLCHLRVKQLQCDDLRQKAQSLNATHLKLSQIAKRLHIKLNTKLDILTNQKSMYGSKFACRSWKAPFTLEYNYTLISNYCINWKKLIRTIKLLQESFKGKVF